MEARVENHESAKYPNAYAATRRPVELVYYEMFPVHKEAPRREIQIKNGQRQRKVQL